MLQEAPTARETWGPQRPTASGDRIRDSKHSNTIAQVSQDGGFPTEVGKGQYIVTRPSTKREGKWTLVCQIQN